MREIWAYVGFAFVLIGLALLIDVNVIFRFTHPAMTETQLFLANWQEIAVMAACLLWGYILINNIGGKSNE